MLGGRDHIRIQRCNGVSILRQGKKILGRELPLLSGIHASTRSLSRCFLTTCVVEGTAWLLLPPETETLDFHSFSPLTNILGGMY